MIGGKRNIPLPFVHALFESGTLGGLTDGQILERFATRDGKASEAAFAALVERHGPMVFRLCRSILSDSHEAQDAFQATFLVLAQKAGSLRVRDSLGPWLHQVALRVASCARASAARRRKHERRAAEMSAHSVVEDPPEDFAPVLHREVAALPDRYRSAVVLCCLQGLTHAQAAQQLGCPVGTLQSRLARGRERLRDRLVRRGIAPSIALLGTTTSARVADTALPVALRNATVRAAIRLAAGRAGISGAISAEVAMLKNEFTRGMLMTRLKLASLTFVTMTAIGVGAYTFQARGIAAPGPETEVPDSEPTGQEDRQEPRPKLLPDRLDFGPLHVGAIGEAGVYFFLEEEHERGEVEAKVVPPRFLKVKSLRVREQTRHEKRGRLINLVLSIDTSRGGDYSGDVRIDYGDHRVKLPVSARVLPPDETLTKVLVVAPEFGAMPGNPEYYQPWFELVEAANLDVSYLDPRDEGLPVEFTDHDKRGMPVLPEWFKRYDVVLLADGGPVFIRSSFDIRVLQSYVYGGGRLIVVGSSAIVDSAENANEILKPFGLKMSTTDVTRGRTKDNMRWAPFTIEGKNFIRPDPLTRGVEAVVFRRATPVYVTEGDRGEILLRDPEFPTRGFAAISRDGGEVIALGPSLLLSWLGEKESGADNALFLRNLLTKPRDR